MAFELLATSLLGTLLVIAVTRTATAYIQKKKVQNVSDFDDKDDTHVKNLYKWAWHIVSSHIMKQAATFL